MPIHPKTADWPWLLGLAGLGILTRLPFVSHILYHWDSINYALALKEYDIASHQPQPPGYILYVWLTRAIDGFVRNPQWTFVGLNVVCSALAAIALYYLGKRMFGLRVGLVASLFLLFSPLFWFYSEIALPNVIDALAVTLIAWLLYEVIRGRVGYVLPAASMLGIVGGFRQQTMVFMAPLTIYALRKTRFRQMALAAGWAGILFLGSFVPMVWLAGGLQQYRQATSGLSTSFFTETSILMGGGWTGLLQNVAKWSVFTLYALSLAVVPLFIWMIWKIKKAPAILKDERAWFLALWIVPSLLFYTLIHMGGHGLIFTFLPAVILIAAKAFVDLVSAIEVRRWRWLFAVSLGVILFVDLLLFAAVSNRPFSGTGFKTVNWQTIRENDRYFRVRFDLIKETFDPERTVVYAETWRHAQYYLPEYLVLSVPSRLSEEPWAPNHVYVVHDREYQIMEAARVGSVLPAYIRDVVFFDPPSLHILSESSGGHVGQLSAAGEDLYYAQLEEQEVLDFENGQFRIIRE